MPMAKIGIQFEYNSISALTAVCTWCYGTGKERSGRVVEAVRS